MDEDETVVERATVVGNVKVDAINREKHRLPSLGGDK